MNLKEILSKEILPFVEKPARYAGGEFNSIVKNPEGKTRVALIYPDVYEVGISNLGLKILYNILNEEKDIFCERAYAPWFDMESKLREKNIPLFSLETKTPLNEFDIIGFSFQYELTITNFLNILDICKIPLHSNERNNPFIIGGGPILSNPEVLAPFLDVIVIGDGESRVVEITSVIAAGKKSGKKKLEILEQISKIEGCYVPVFYKTREINGYSIPEGKTIRRYVEKDLNRLSFPISQIVPNIQAVQDRAVIEVARGCTRGCRFCQAGMIYRPIRERDIPTIIDCSRKIITKTGYREIALLSLSISDYSGLYSLINHLEEEFSPHGISFSLPSLRLDTFTLELAEKAQEIRKSGLTFAVEGGSNSIRNYINKGVNEDELFNVISIARNLGWKSVKLYFMIGFKDVKEEVEAIVELAKRMSTSFRTTNITISIAVLIPKPHTPFQWKRQLSPEEGKMAFDMLIKELKNFKNINIRYNNPFVSFLEGVFSRGDRKVSKVIERAFRKGARFDGWSEHFNFELWMECFKEEGVDPYFYLAEKNLDTIFPWDIIDERVSKKFLTDEFKKALSEELTKDCREKCNSYCGNCDKEIKNVFVSKKEIKKDEKFLSNIWIKNEPKYIFRFLYNKLDNAKYFSTIDVENHFSYSFVRANVGISFTKGFNPHIKVRTLDALPVGIESRYEIGEVELSIYEEVNEIIKRLTKCLPQGLEIKEGIIFKKGEKKLSNLSPHFIELVIKPELSKEEIERNYNDSKNFIKKTIKNEKVISLHNYIKKWELESGDLFITYYQEEGGARLKDIIEGLTGFDIRKAAAFEPVILKRFIIKENEEVLLLRV